MTYRQKRCGLWKSFSHILMSCSRGFYVTGSGFVIRRIPAAVVPAVKPLAYRFHCTNSPFGAVYLAAKACALLPIVRCFDFLWFEQRFHGTRLAYRLKPVSYAHLLRSF